MMEQKPTRLLTAGVIGSAVTAVCCFTPALVILFSVVGIGSLAGYLDYVLLPALGIFLTMTGYALIRRRDRRCNVCEKETVTATGERVRRDQQEECEPHGEHTGKSSV